MAQAAPSETKINTDPTQLVRGQAGRRARKLVEVAGKLYVEPPKCRKHRATIYPVRTPGGYPLAARFGMEMRIGAPCKIMNTVVEFEQDRLIDGGAIGRNEAVHALHPELRVVTLCAGCSPPGGGRGKELDNGRQISLLCRLSL
jgi:hypothetical protein